MTEELSGRRIVVPEGRELGQLVRMLEEYGAEAIPCPMIAIRDAPDAKSVEAWLGRFANGICASELEALGVQVSIAPTGGTFFMKPLVRELAAAFTKDGKAGEA